MQVCLFEDSFVDDFSPLNYFRHTSELICGGGTLFGKIRTNLSRRVTMSLHCRRSLQDYLQYRFPQIKINSLVNDDYLFLNSRFLYPRKYLSELLRSDSNTFYFLNEGIVAVAAKKDCLPQLTGLIENRSDDNLLTFERLSPLNLKRIEVRETSGVTALRFPWDLIHHHSAELNQDLGDLNIKKGSKKPSFSVINRKNVYVSSRAEVQPQVVLDASDGRIYISSNVKVEPFSYIKGPAYIAEGAVLRSGTRVYGPVFIGSNSKVSGEVSHSIIHSNVNKQHLGFLGHSYICDWVNLGAGTTTSNLKNNYSAITVKMRDGTLDTQSTFLGSMIGDHTKTGINTLLNTGSIIGISCNLFGSGYMPKLVRSFSWLDADTKETYLYDREKALSTAKTSMRRRRVEMTRQYEDLFMALYDKTRENLL